MNFLGHLILSGTDPDVIFGNFIADSVKGKSYLLLPDCIQKGITLHRVIDDFTDNNTEYLKGKRRFYQRFPKMGGVINDILYDYLLWRFDKKTKSINLEIKITKFYKILDQKIHQMPPRIREMYHYMRRDDWLNNYQHEKGIKRALHGIGKRINYSDNLESSFEILENSMKSFDEEFEIFYSQIKEKTSFFL